MRALVAALFLASAAGAQTPLQPLVLGREPAREVIAMTLYSRSGTVEDARCGVRWHYGADGDSVVVDSLGPAEIARRDSMHVIPPDGKELCPGSEPLFHTHLLWMLTLAAGKYIAPRTPSGCDALIAIRGAHPWDVIVDVTPISFVPFLYVTVDTVEAHYHCP